MWLEEATSKGLERRKQERAFLKKCLPPRRRGAPQKLLLVSELGVGHGKVYHSEMTDHAKPNPGNASAETPDAHGLPAAAAVLRAMPLPDELEVREPIEMPDRD